MGCVRTWCRVVSADVVRLGTLAGVVVVSAAVGYLRFFGDVSLPAKPPPPPSAGPATVALADVAASKSSWSSFVSRDAASAGLPAPSIADMSRKLIYRADEQPRALAPGDAPIEVAGLRLTAAAQDDEDRRKLLVLSIENLTDHDLAYRVVTEPRPGGASCNQRSILAHDAIVVGRGKKVVRSECSFRPGMSLGIARVETVELLPLMAAYVSKVPPAAVGADPRLARGHRPDLPSGWSVCATMAAQSVRTDIETGRIAWRDLVDFYARHRCETYTFPEGYRAFEKDGQRPLPAVD